MLLVSGALLWLITVAGDAAHGVLMFPILKQHSERIALGHFGVRIMDAVFIALMVLLLLLQIPLGSEYVKAAAPTPSTSNSERCVRTGEPICLSDGHDDAWYRWCNALHHVIQRKVGSALAGSLGPRWIHSHLWWDDIGDDRIRFGSGFLDPRWAVGSVHRRMACREGIQFFCLRFTVDKNQQLGRITCAFARASQPVKCAQDKAQGGERLVIQNSSCWGCRNPRRIRCYYRSKSDPLNRTTFSIRGIDFGVHCRT